MTRSIPILFRPGSFWHLLFQEHKDIPEPNNNHHVLVPRRILASREKGNQYGFGIPPKYFPAKGKYVKTGLSQNLRHPG